MKTFLIGLLMIILLIITGMAFGADSDPPANFNPEASVSATKIRPYDVVLNTVTVLVTDSNDTALTAKTKYWDALQIGTKFQKVDNSYNQVEIAFVCEGNDVDPNGMTFNFKIHAARWLCSARTVCSGTAACGDLLMSRSPSDPTTKLASGAADPNYRWVSGISSTTDYWESVAFVNETEAHNGIATIDFDLRGYAVLWCEITGIAGAEVGNKIYCVMTGY